MADEIPTTADVRNHFAYGCGPKHTWDGSREDFDRWLAAHDAEVRAAALAEQEGRRWFTAAYRAGNGNVIAIGGETVVQEHAQKTVDDFAREDDEGPDYFLATRISPPWMPVEQEGESNA